MRLSFIGNGHCVRRRYVSHKSTVKAAASFVTIYDQVQRGRGYARAWEHGGVFGSERFQNNYFQQLAAA